jgi:hypothetical protein
VLHIATAIDAIQSQRFIVDSFRTSPATKPISAAQSFLCIGDQLSKSMRTHHRTPVVSAGVIVWMQRIVTTGTKIPNRWRHKAPIFAALPLRWFACPDAVIDHQAVE